MNIEEFRFVQLRTVSQLDVLGGSDDGLELFYLELNGRENDRWSYFLTFDQALVLAKQLLEKLPETDADGIPWELYGDPHFVDAENYETERKAVDAWPATVELIAQAKWPDDPTPLIALCFDVRDSEPRKQGYIISERNAQGTLSSLLRALVRKGIVLEVTEVFESEDDCAEIGSEATDE